MFAKKIVFFVAALFVVQVSADTSSMWENVQKMFTDMINKAESTATDVSNHIQQWAQEEQQKIEAIQADISNRINEGIANLKDKAEEVGANVSVCFQELPQGGMNVAKDLTQGAIKCVTDEVDQGLNIVTSLMGIAKEANATMAEAKDNWDKCNTQSSGWKVGICQAKVAAGTAMKETQYSVQAGVQVSKGATLVSTAETTMGTCVAADMATAPVKIAELMSELGQCVMSKIN